MTNELITIKDKLWNGSLNVRILLEQSTDTREYLLSVHRNSYYPFYYDQLVSYFKVYVPRLEEHSIWLEYDGVPVKWNLPIGTLYDYLHLTTRLTDNSNVWTLILKYKDFPSDYIIPFYKEGTQINYLKSLSEVLVNQLKQSCFVINGSSKVIMNLSGADTAGLLDAIQTHNLAKFESVNDQLVALAKFRKIPVRIYVAGTDRVIQVPIVGTTSAGEEIILGEVLRNHVPEMVHKNAKPYIHGIDSSSLSGVGIIDVWKVFKHLDNFLYIVMI